MNTANAPRKFAFKNILPRPFRRDTSDKEGALDCTVSERASAHTLVNERQPPNASNEEKASHPVVKIVQKTIPCISRKAVKTHFEEEEEEESKGGMDFMDPALNIEPAPSVRPEGIVTISPMISPILVQGVLVPSPTLVHLHDSDFPFSTGTEDPVQSVQNHTHSSLRVSCAELASLTGANNANIGGTRLPAITGHDCAESISDYGTGTTASDYWPGANSNMLDVSNIPEILVDDTTSFELGDGYSEGAADASPPVLESPPPQSPDSENTIKLSPRAYERHARRYFRFKNIINKMPELDNSLAYPSPSSSPLPSLSMSPVASTPGLSTPLITGPGRNWENMRDSLDIYFGESESVDDDFAGHRSHVKDSSRRYGIYHKEESVGDFLQRR